MRVTTVYVSAVTDGKTLQYVHEIDEAVYSCMITLSVNLVRACTECHHLVGFNLASL